MKKIKNKKKFSNKENFKGVKKKIDNDPLTINK